MKVASLARTLVLAFPAVIGAQVAIIQMKVVEGEGGVHAAGGRAARPLTVEVTDETGHTVAGAAVSFHIPELGPGGIFSNGLRTDVFISDAAGRATVRGFQLNRNPGPFQIRITAAKDQARAGIVSLQYISEPTPTAERGVPLQQAAPRVVQPIVQPGVLPARHSGRKWVFVALMVAGAAAGVTVARVQGSSSGTPATAPGPVPGGAPAGFSVGIPIVTIVHP